LQAEDASSATAEFRRALELDPDLPHVRNDLAWILATDANLRDSREALEQAQQAVKLLDPHPNRAPADRAAFLDTLAEALLLNGRAKEALSKEREAFAVDPQNSKFPARLKHFEDAATGSTSTRPKD